MSQSMSQIVRIHIYDSRILCDFPEISICIINCKPCIESLLYFHTRLGLPVSCGTSKSMWINDPDENLDRKSRFLLIF